MVRLPSFLTHAASLDPQPMRIIDERPADAATLGALIDAAFAEAEHRGGNEGAIVAALRTAGALPLSLVALGTDGVPVGHVAFSPVRIVSETGDGVAGDWYGLAPLSVLPERQREGIGAALVEAGLARLRAMGAAGCVLLGDPDYYGRFGFRSVPGLGYGDAPAPYVQAISFGGPPPVGDIAYHAAFGG